MYASADDFQECHFEETSILLEFSGGSLHSCRESYWIGLHSVICTSHSNLSESILLWDPISSKPLFTAANRAEAINFCTLFSTEFLGVNSDLSLWQEEISHFTETIFNSENGFFDFEETAIYSFNPPRVEIVGLQGDLN